MGILELETQSAILA